MNQAPQRRPSIRIETLSKKLLVTLTSLKELVILTKPKIRCTKRVHIERGVSLDHQNECNTVCLLEMAKQGAQRGNEVTQAGNGFTCRSSSSQT